MNQENPLLGILKITFCQSSASHKFCSLVHFFRLCRGPWAAETEDMAWREQLDDQIPRHGELF